MRKQRGMDRHEISARNKAAEIAAAQFQIERGVEVPPPARLDRAIKYPFDKMELKDSVFIPDVKAPTIHACLTRFKKHPRGIGKKFSVRTLTEDGVAGVRVWRTE